MSETTTIYPEDLPPEDDPEVVELVDRWVAEAKVGQRPLRALAVALVCLLIGVVIWGELNRLSEFRMPWLLMAASAVVLGVLLGFPYRFVGRLFDWPWAVLAGALAVLMAVAGDLHAVALISSRDPAVGWSDAIAAIDLGTFLGARTPLDWLVAGLAGAGAFAGARPAMDRRQLRMEARIAIHLEDLEREEAEFDETEQG
ncbi:MAG TPA: hypothetical protein ENK57_24465 [Polyangiaceae bacterium]|nr:hypothetical protein [Polyangiaceae bacterium]